MASRLRDATRLENAANSAGNEAARWQTKVAGFVKEKASLLVRISRAEKSEREADDRRRAHEDERARRREASDRAAMVRRLTAAEELAKDAFVARRQPKRERLRVLILGASPDGELRVGREQKRIRAAVERALHRDLVELDGRPAATSADLLDGITRFRPHVVHFSGHGDSGLIAFEDEIDTRHDGVIVSAGAFARAVTATDDPPLLVVLNACNSAAQIPRLVELLPFAIGMSAEIEDGDAIGYAAQFYAAIANGHSIDSAHRSGQAALELAGLSAAELPSLGHAQGARSKPYETRVARDAKWSENFLVVAVDFRASLGQQVIMEYLWSANHPDQNDEGVWRLVHYWVEPQIPFTDPLDMRFE